MKTFKQFNESRKEKFKLKDLEEYFGQHDMAVISAERKDHPDNKAMTRRLESVIGSSPYPYEPAFGGFVENKGQDNEANVDGEHSFVVVDIHDVGSLKKFAVFLGKKLPPKDTNGGPGGQDSILFSGKDDKTAFLIGTTKRKGADPKLNGKYNLGKPRWGSRGEYYTKIKDGYFTFGS